MTFAYKKDALCRKDFLRRRKIMATKKSGKKLHGSRRIKKVASLKRIFHGPTAVE
jgi:hypothetical protein